MMSEENVISSISIINPFTRETDLGLEPTINECTCTNLEIPEGAPPVVPSPELFSAACHWSSEEQVIQREQQVHERQADTELFYDASPMFHDPHSFGYYDYGYGYHDTHKFGPAFGHGFGRHHAKLTGDPTLLISLIRWARIGSSHLAGDDDQVDRMNYQITSVLLLLLIAVTGLRQYISRLPLQCWIPQEFSRGWEEYAEHYCWVSNTYFAEVQNKLPQPEQRQSVVHYYQWAPFVLAIQAAGFVIPCALWRIFQNTSGFHVQRILRGAMQLTSTTSTPTSEGAKGLACYMDAVIYRRQYKRWRVNIPQSIRITSTKMPDGDDQGYSAIPVTNNFIRRTPGVSSISNIALIPTIQRSHKKFAAPSPPRRLTSKMKHTKDEHAANKKITSKTSRFCLWPTSCFCKNKSRSVQRRSICNFTSLKFSRTQGFCPTTNASSCFRCCDPVSSNPTDHGKSNINERRYTYTTGVVCCCIRTSLRAIFRLLLTSIRVIIFLACLIPGCLCHWLRNAKRCKCINRSNSFLFFLYTTIKFLYILNLVAQLWFMPHFLGIDSYFFGFYLLRDLIEGRKWSQTGNFPRVTYCDFETKKSGKNYKYTLQCVLPLNLFLEKIYVFLWFWMVFLLGLTAYSLIKWLSRLSSTSSRIMFIQNLLIPWKYSVGRGTQLDQASLKRFVDTYLDRNGVIILWLISINAGELVSGELIYHLWEIFCQRQHQLNQNNRCQLMDKRTDRGLKLTNVSHTQLPEAYQNLSRTNLSNFATQPRNNLYRPGLCTHTQPCFHQHSISDFKVLHADDIQHFRGDSSSDSIV